MEAVMSGVEFRIQRDQDPPNGSCAAASSSSSTSAVFRKIEFHPARKPFNGFSNGGSDFKIETLNPASANKRPAAVTPLKRPDASEFFEIGLDPELRIGITVRKIGAGLENLGNTCFLNSVLQCLTYTEPLAAYLQSAAHQKSCHVAGFCALCAIQKHVRTALQATGRILAPKDLVSNLRCISRNFRNCRQEDAHEYMINLLECMHKCCLPSGVPSESLDAYKSSLVHKIFGGRLRSQVKCTQCSHCSDTFDPFLDLSLDIARADSLQKALSHFTAVELLDDGAKIYQCERCKQKVKAVKQLTVSKAPYVLTIHFKRFEAHRSEKIDKKVQFVPTIDMKPFVSGSYEGDLKYTLYGVLVHYGRSIHSGHYSCFIRTASGMWYSLDDNRVKQVAERTVFDQKAYMLFYVRDRKNAAPKNAAAIVLKDSSRGSFAANSASSLFPSNSGQVNGSTDIKSCILDASAARTQKDSHSILTVTGTLKKEAPSKQINDVVMAKCVTAKGNSKNKCTASTVSPGEILKPMSPFLNGIITTQNLGNMPISGAMSGICIEEKNSASKLNMSVDVSYAGCLSHETSQTVNLPSVSIPPNVTNIRNPAVRSSMEASDVTLAGNSSKMAKPPEKPDCNNSQVESATSCNSLNKKAALNDQNLAQRSNETAIPCDMSTESVKISTSDRVNIVTSRKIHKPHMKNMSMGLKLFKLALGLCKKKKHKRRKLRASAVKNIAEELLSQQRAADQGPSTSQAASTVSSGSTCFLEKDNSISVQDTSKSDATGDLLMDNAIGELKDRINQNGSVLASERQAIGNSVVSEASQRAKRKRDSSKDGQEVKSEKAALSILTRGLPETVVAKWDDQELPYRITRSESENVNIGYVADEWDEEYDRGKRKKVKSNKVDFGGPNQFQLLASKKLKQSAERKAKWRRQHMREP
ncbi:PREDICTED: ubiquitin carboxyl-terminal hydrolase 23 [Tarenaya hassleriana]|uniref:ubiquitin carboxyl-terminal hydrolase 23 n=1 Tax=Tarenaya hassleriana TaxID=28532 RepID=UPI00053C6D21|nr:PREDICTED: ubiquitin carboxyl-terminal hydrolase 23 [Tarenaya hassleriana]